MTEPDKQEATFVVKGSRGNEYTTTFKFDGVNLYAYCSCRAGEHGQYCKHRFAILQGDELSVISPNKHQVADIVS